MAYSYKGAITFGLVFIPITLSLSAKEHDIGFNMLEKHTKSRVKYKKTCVDCDNKEIKNEDIVKGFQYEKDKYVIFSDDDFEKLKTKKDKNITIEQFVSENEVNPIYFDKSYYINPTGATKAYSVLLKAMQSEKKVGIAKTVLGTKETLMMIRPINGKLIASTMFYSSEIQQPQPIEKTKVTEQEVDLAKTLINQMTKPFEPTKFKDEYYERVKKAINQKIAGGEIIEHHDETKPTKIINLMEALKQSIETEPKRKKA